MSKSVTLTQFHFPDNSRCANNDGNYDYNCDAGFIMNAESTAHGNVDEHADADANDYHDWADCTDTEPGFTCPDRYDGTGISFANDGSGRFDIIECDDGTATCPDFFTCENNNGS